MTLFPGRTALLLQAGFSATVSMAALLYFLNRVEANALREALGRLHWVGIALALVLAAASLLLLALRWHLLLRREKCSVHAAATVRVSLFRAWDGFLYGGFFGGCIGAERYAHWFNRERNHVARSMFLDRFLGLDAVFTLSILGAVLSWLAGGFQGLRLLGESDLVWLLLLLVLGWLAGVVLWLDRSAAGRAWFQAAGEFFAEASELVGVAWRILLPWFLGLLAIALRIMVFPVLLWSVSGEELPGLQMAWVFPLLYLAAAVPVSVHGLGVRELAAMLLLSGYGVSAEEAGATALLVFFVGAVVAAGAVGLLARERAFRKKFAVRPSVETISVIIPALNEEGALPETLRHLQQFPEISEIIVVDGGSRDRTREIAAAQGARVFIAAPGRGGQMRLGAMQAKGDVVLLLHSDTVLPEHGIEEMLNCLRDPTVAGGGFYKTFRERKLLLVGSRLRCAVRLYLGGVVFGDQAIFVRRGVLEGIGGVPEMPLMEEFELCRRLRQAGRLALADATVVTSARRFLQHGILRTYWLMLKLTVLYWAGVSPEKLKRLYEPEKAG
jgi:rSAM/selenodomain-associated transferase 2